MTHIPVMSECVDTLLWTSIDASGVARLFATAQGESLPKAAELLAVAGLPVFPCVLGGKRPLLRHGFRDASTEQSVVGSWWERWPDANIGMPTGAVSGLVVVDVDVRSSGSGMEAFARVAPVVGADRWGLLVRTPSGGAHFYYPYEPGVSGGSWACGSAHVDFRGDGGYVIVPPSIIIAPGHGGVGYRLIQSQPGAVPVDGGRLEAAVDPGRAERRSLAKRVGLRRSTVNADRLVGWVSSLQMGERNQGLFWAACRLAESGQAIDDTLGLLTSAAERAGLVEREIRTTVVSAYRHVHPTVSGSAVVTASVPSREPVVEAMVL